MHLYLSMMLWLVTHLLEYVHFALNVFYSLHTGVLPTIPSASDFNTVLSSDQNTLDTHSQHTHSQHSTSQEDLLEQDETNLCPAAVQLADAQVCAPGILINLLLFIYDHAHVIASLILFVCVCVSLGIIHTGCFQAFVESHWYPAPGCSSTQLQDVFWGAPILQRHS